MIVISIIVFLIAFAAFPYSYYMKRSYVERSRDLLGQEWIIAHKEVRNGKLFEVNKHANIVLIFERSQEWVYEYLLSGSTIPDINQFTPSGISNPNIKFEKFHSFDSKIKILDIRWVPSSSSPNKVWYMISAPYWTGIFFTPSVPTPFSLTGIFLTIGYQWASIDTGHARDMLLRPYLQ